MNEVGVSGKTPSSIPPSSNESSGTITENTSQETALYVLLNSENYSQSILGAINLGGKTNIVSSLVGCMASILYGEDDIPDNWLMQLRGKDILDKFI